MTQDPSNSPQPDRSNEPQRGGPIPVAAAVVTALAGVWLLVTALVMGLGHHPVHGRMHGMGRMLWHHEMIMRYRGQVFWNWFGVVAAILLFVGALLMVLKPASAIAWAAAVVILSILVLLSGAGGILAGALGIVGGILAIRRQPLPRGP
jgi:hypothetical protein